MRYLAFAALIMMASNVALATTIDERADNVANAIRKGTSSVTKYFPAAGYANGFAGFVKENRLVITHSESMCNLYKNGYCQIDSYITRSEYKKHRDGDAMDFCGVLLRWEAPENDLKKWLAVSGLAMHIAEGRVQFALQIIDDKNTDYCNRQ